MNDVLHFKQNKVQEPVYKFSYREDSDGYLRSLRISSKAEKGKGTGRGTVASGIDPLTKESIQEEVIAGEKS